MPNDICHNLHWYMILMCHVIICRVYFLCLLCVCVCVCVCVQGSVRGTGPRGKRGRRERLTEEDLKTVSGSVCVSAESSHYD